ncbi:hypothetical protein TNCV_1772881 [Trichonephila clavipes]|nr:hypothetical protein TNCV_1772881 [Trichonephila clavipes]
METNIFKQAVRGKMTSSSSCPVCFGEFIKLTMLSVVLNPVNASLSVFLSAQPYASISSGAKGCIGSSNESLESGQQEKDILPSSKPPTLVPERETSWKCRERVYRMWDRAS